MSRDDADDLVDAALDPAKATIVTLRPAPQSKRATVRVSDAFREDRRRKAEDPAEARRPLDWPLTVNPFARAETSALANGLHVLLVPLSTMPTVEIRLVFPVGTGDEPSDQRGVAMLAAQSLEPAFDTTMFEFVKQGGTLSRDVAFDHTVFATRGLASRVDVLLAGLAATVREGGYDAESVRDAMRGMSTTSAADDRVASAAWREAVYGANHPYRYASQWQHVERKAFDVQALQSFRAAHYRPAGATLVIAGNFDPDDARRWVDYHFHEWSGEAAPRRSPQVTPRPLAFAQYRDGAQVSLELAFALPMDHESANDLLGELVNTAIADVREQLAASYGLHAFLVRDRLATRLEITGAIDASRTADALTLLRDRLGKLRAHDDETAGMFVAARRHVVARLASVDTRPEALAERMVDALDRGLPMLDLVDADDARRLTIDRLAPLLERLDVANAALLMRGPKAAVDAAYDALGRKPVVLSGH
jgi:zinc protease